MSQQPKEEPKSSIIGSLLDNWVVSKYFKPVEEKKIELSLRACEADMLAYASMHMKDNLQLLKKLQPGQGVCAGLALCYIKLIRLELDPLHPPPSPDLMRIAQGHAALIALKESKDYSKPNPFVHRFINHVISLYDKQEDTLGSLVAIGQFNQKAIIQLLKFLQIGDAFALGSNNLKKKICNHAVAILRINQNNYCLIDSVSDPVLENTKSLTRVVDWLCQALEFKSTNLIEVHWQGLSEKPDKIKIQDFHRKYGGNLALDATQRAFLIANSYKEETICAYYQKKFDLTQMKSPYKAERMVSLATGSKQEIYSDDLLVESMADATSDDGEKEFDKVEILLESKVDINLKNTNGDTALFLAAKDKKDQGVVSFLIDRKADVNIRNLKGEIPLSSTTATRVLRILLEAKSDINSTDALGKTPLYHQLADGRIDNVKILLESKADSQVRTTSGISLLEKAANKINSEISKLCQPLSLQHNIEQVKKEFKKSQTYLAQFELLVSHDFEGLTDQIKQKVEKKLLAAIQKIERVLIDSVDLLDEDDANQWRKQLQVEIKRVVDYLSKATLPKSKDQEGGALTVSFKTRG